MDMHADFEARLQKAGVTFMERDAQLLQAIHKHASLNKAATALERSYSRSQQRVVELEDAFGPLVDRQRGGSGGGGSTLTKRARTLLEEFDRLRAEFTGVTEVEETVLPGTIADCDGALATVETTAGPVLAIVPTTTQNVRLSIRADAITLHAPGTVPESDTSARNHFHGEIVGIDHGETLARITLDIGAETTLTALVTQMSTTTLHLSPGDEIVASFKATATRAFPAKRYLPDA